MTNIISADRRSWVSVPAGSDFSLQNLPFGVYQPAGQSPRLASAIGDYVIDLLWLSQQGFFEGLGIAPEVFAQPVLNPFIALGKATTGALRLRLADLLDAAGQNPQARQQSAAFLVPRQQAPMCMPLQIGDYTDFYSSREHATNVGIMFRGKENALMPNWLHLPVGNHGRASSIVVSGTPIRRPKGQMLPPGAEAPVFGPSRRLDFELEMAFVVGKSTQLGDTVPIGEAEDYIFGLMLFNDWSARDIQAWEYQPLGPFLGKNFGSTVAPWVVTLDALEPFRTESPVQEPSPLPYLQQSAGGKYTYDIHLRVDLQAGEGEPSTISQSNFKYLYWSMAQQLAHHTVNGCNLNIGDLMASGTISGPTPDSYGSMLELSWRGERPITLVGGQQRSFLEDGDTLSLYGWCERDGLRIGFGEAAGKVIG